MAGIPERVVETIQYIMAQRRMSQKDIAGKIGVSTATISDVLNNNTQPGGKVILNLLIEFQEISCDYVIRGKGELIIRKNERGQVQDPRTEYLRYYNLPDLVNKVLELEAKLQEMQRLYQDLKNDTE